MNKLGILGIAIAVAFVTGIITVNPVAEGVSGWQGALIEVNEDIEGILLFLEENSDFFEFDLEQMSEDIAKNAEDIEVNAADIDDNSDRITDLENEVVSIENQVGNCMEGDIPKYSTITGEWSCQEDATGDGGGGGPGDSAAKFRFEPQTDEPEVCTADTYGTMYYRDLDGADIGPDALCICTIIEGSGPGEFEYMDIFTNNPDPCLPS